MIALGTSPTERVKAKRVLKRGAAASDVRPLESLTKAAVRIPSAVKSDTITLPKARVATFGGGSFADGGGAGRVGVGDGDAGLGKLAGELFDGMAAHVACTHGVDAYEEVNAVLCNHGIRDCDEPAPVDCETCGNGVREGGETCDGLDWAATSCADFDGYIDGELACDTCYARLNDGPPTEQERARAPAHPGVRERQLDACRRLDEVDRRQAHGRRRIEGCGIEFPIRLGEQDGQQGRAVDAAGHR